MSGDLHAGHVSIAVGQEMNDLLAGSDCFIVNLESPLIAHPSPTDEKSYHLSSSESALDGFDAIDVAILGNNHICDHGCAGLSRTIEILDDRGIEHCGAGLDISLASEPVERDIDGTKIGILSISTEVIGSRVATSDECGCYMYDETSLRSSIESLRDRVDTLIVAVHDGLTNYHYPAPEQIKKMRNLIDMGVDIVMGHHPHVMQGYERYREGVIFYSLGNLYFQPYERHGRMTENSQENRSGVIASVEIEEGSVSDISIHHTVQDESSGTLRLVSDPRQIMRRERVLEKLSKRLSSDDYDAFYKRYVFMRLIKRSSILLNPAKWKTLNMGKLQSALIALRRLAG